jgi:hypothetical protein
VQLGSTVKKLAARRGGHAEARSSLNEADFAFGYGFWVYGFRDYYRHMKVEKVRSSRKQMSTSNGSATILKKISI